MRQVPLDEVFVLALWVSTWLFGFQTLLYFTALWILVYRRSPNTPVNKPMVLTATAMLVVSAAYNYVCLDRIVEAFWRHVDGDPVKYFQDVDRPAKFGEASLWTLQALIGDSFLTFRCWVVWGRQWKFVLLPIIFLFATLGLGIWLEVEYSKVPLQEINPQLTDRLLGKEAALVAMTFVQNLFITCLIALRLWRKHNELKQAIPTERSKMYWRAIWLIVESGAVVALSHLILGITAISKNSGYEIVIQAIPFIIGIMFTGIIVRVQARKKHQSVYGSDIPPDVPENTLPSIRFAHTGEATTNDWSRTARDTGHETRSTSTRILSTHEDEKKFVHHPGSVDKL